LVGGVEYLTGVQQRSLRLGGGGYFLKMQISTQEIASAEWVFHTAAAFDGHSRHNRYSAKRQFVSLKPSTFVMHLP
jgi:hypothetical protein